MTKTKTPKQLIEEFLVNREHRLVWMLCKFALVNKIFDLYSATADCVIAHILEDDAYSPKFCVFLQPLLQHEPTKSKYEKAIANLLKNKALSVGTRIQILKWVYKIESYTILKACEALMKDKNTSAPLMSACDKYIKRWRASNERDNR